MSKRWEVPMKEELRIKGNLLLTEMKIRLRRLKTWARKDRLAQKGNSVCTYNTLLSIIHKGVYFIPLMSLLPGNKGLSYTCHLSRL